MLKSYSDYVYIRYIYLLIWIARSLDRDVILKFSDRWNMRSNLAWKAIPIFCRYITKRRYYEKRGWKKAYSASKKRPNEHFEESFGKWEIKKADRIQHKNKSNYFTAKFKSQVLRTTQADQFETNESESSSFWLLLGIQNHRQTISHILFINGNKWYRRREWESLSLHHDKNRNHKSRIYSGSWNQNLNKRNFY